MTDQELEALPDASPQLGYIEKLINGKKVRIPTLVAAPVALYQREDDGVVMDANGIWWVTGWLNGVHVRRKFKE